MTTITIDRALLEQALNALLLPCDRWNKQQFLIVKGAIESLNAALAAPATAPDERIKELEAENDQLRKDVDRYQWLKSAKGLTLESERGAPWTRENGSTFIPSHRLCAGGTQFAPHETLDGAIDAAMKGTP